MDNIEINDLSPNADLNAGEMGDITGGIAPLPSPMPVSRVASTRLTTNSASLSGAALNTKTIIDPLFKTQ